MERSLEDFGTGIKQSSDDDDSNPLARPILRKSCSYQSEKVRSNKKRSKTYAHITTLHAAILIKIADPLLASCKVQAEKLYPLLDSHGFHHLCIIADNLKKLASISEKLHQYADQKHPNA